MNKITNSKFETIFKWSKIRKSKQARFGFRNWDLVFGFVSDFDIRILFCLRLGAITNGCQLRCSYSFDLDLTIHGRSLVLRIGWDEHCVAGPEDALLSPHSDAKLTRKDVDHLLLGMLVRLGSSASGEAVAPDFDLPSFDCGSFGRGVLRADHASFHLAPVIKCHIHSLASQLSVLRFDSNPKYKTQNAEPI